MAAHGHKQLTAADVTLPADSGWRKLPILFAILAVIGIAGTFAVGDPHGHSAHLSSWLIAVLYFASIGIGATLFIAIFFVGRAEWHVAARRPVLAMASTLPFIAALLGVIFLGDFGALYPWATPEAAADPVLVAKAPFLNEGFFKIRFLVYVAIFGGISWCFRLQLLKQDETGDHAISRRLRAISAPFVGLMALSLTFLSFDWMMSTDPHWFSTMYGLIYFAGGFMSTFALLAIFLIAFRGNMGGAVTQHHFHGTGKMMWGLMVFWAYTSFSQFMLIWYANIPEETMWYAHRWGGGWKPWTIVLFLGHFIIPFWALMSRHMKREPRTLFLGAAWLLVMHYVDLFWQLRPNLHHGHGSPQLLLTDVLAFVGVGGLFLALMTHFLTRSPLVPIKDPLLPASMAYEDV